ncbi:MAG: SDR family NAD(P)-dependent oxidoreductase [Terracidiphilus sp.]
MNKIDLEGKRAIITGGAQGIGLAIGKKLLDCGAVVTLWDANQAVLVEAANQLKQGERVETVVVDVSDPASVEGAFQETTKNNPRIDILVANAGIAGPNHPTWEYPIEAWKRVVDVDLIGVFLSCRAVLPTMIRQKYGRIVNVASIAGKEGNPNASAYSAAKAGVIALTKSLGKEVASENIAVNCITPAAVRTAIFDQMSESHIEYMLSRIPRGRFLGVEEVAAMVAWLVSSENSFTTGAVFDLSGGRATY